MAPSLLKEVQEKLNRFVARQGYGAIKTVSDRVEMTPTYLGRIRKGQVEPETKTLIAIRAVIDVLERELSSTNHAAENPPNYGESADAFDIMAGDFESIAKRLRSSAYTPAEKVRYLRKWLTDAHGEVESFATKLKASTPRPTGNRK